MDIGKFSEFYVDVTKDATKIPQEQYLAVGRYPIIDQGQKSIAGMWDNPDGLYEKVPAIVFGDHTRAIKYVDTPFFIGADGVKVLRPVHSGDNIKYLFYVLQAARIPNLGYSRHFKVVKELEIRMYPRKKQDEIVRVLEQIDSLLEQRQNEILQMNQLVKSRFVEMFGEPFRCPKWKTEQLHVLAESISDGSNIDKQCYKKHDSVLFLRIQNVWFNELRLEDSVYISDVVNKSYFDTSLHKGDLLITKIGRYYTDDSSLGRVSVYLGEDDKANYSNNIMRVRLRDRVNSEFVNALMNLDDYNKYIRNVSVGGTDKRALSKKIIGELPIVVPPEQIQQQYVEFLHQVDKSKLMFQKLHQKLNILQQKAGDI